MKLIRSLMITAATLVFSTSVVFGQGSLVWSGYRAPGALAVAPGQMVTLFVFGLNVTLAHPEYAVSFPLPTTLGGISANVQQGSKSYAVPILAVQQTAPCMGGQTATCVVTAVTVQVPFELIATGNSGASITVSANGSTSAVFPLQPTVDNIHVLTTCDSVLGASASTSGGCTPIVTHADGTPVSAASPAIPGEIVVIYAVGLGQTNPPMQSGVQTPNPPPIIGNSISNLNVQFDFTPNAGPSRPYTLGGGPSSFPPKVATFVGLTPGYAGLYQINVPIPSPPAAPPPICIGNVTSNLTINLGGQTSFDGAPICVKTN